MNNNIQRERLEYEGAAVGISVVFHVLLVVFLLNFNGNASVQAKPEKREYFKISRIEMPLAPLPPPPEPPPEKPIGSPSGTKIAPPDIEKFAPLTEQPEAKNSPASLPAPAVPEQLQVGTMLPARELSALDSARVSRELLAIKDREMREKNRPEILTPTKTTGAEPPETILTEKTLNAIKAGWGSTGTTDGPVIQSLADIYGRGGRGSPLQSMPKPASTTTMEEKRPATSTPTALPPKPLEPYVNVEIATWHPPQSPTEGFFEIRITSKPDSPLRVVPKDIIYVMDVSYSIGRVRCEQFKAGLREALARLNPADRFNIIRFRQDVDFVSPALLRPDEATSEKVQKFIQSQHSAGTTDLFASLLPLSQLNRERGRLLMAMIMTDGMPTVGMRDTLQILNRFAQINAHRSSVFTFAGGNEVDPFLLGFLAYRNQGSLDYVANPAEMAAQFVQLQESLRNPLLLDVNFHFGGISNDNVYPRTLPHFFRDTPLILHGRYARGSETGFALQISGNDATGQPFEMTLRRYFPEVDKGSVTIAQQWAIERINHLLAKWLDTGDLRLHEEAVDVGKRYGVPVPEVRK